MRNSLKVCLLGSVVAALPAGADHADHVYVTSGLERDRCLEGLGAVAEDFFSTGTRGDRQDYYDADQNALIATLEVPDSALYDNPSPKRLRKKNAAAIRGLAEFCEQPPKAVASTNYTETLRFIGNSLPVNEDGDPTVVLMFAYPVGIDPQSPETSMDGAKRPSDAHPLTDRFESPFGTKGEEELLSGARIYAALPDESWAQNPIHRAEIERFFSFQVSLRGGELGSFETDMPTVLSRVERGQVHRLPQRPLSRTDHKLELIDHSAPPGDTTSLFDRPVSTTAISNDALQSGLDNVSVGLSWSCACDVDLLVTPRPDAPPLYYANRETVDGRFLKDYRNPNAERGFETVEFDRPVRLGDVMIAVNLYSGEAPEGVDGKVRIAVGSETYEAPFALAVRSGNGGSGANAVVAERQAPNDHWVLIDPLDVVRGQ